MDIRTGSLSENTMSSAEEDSTSVTSDSVDKQPPQALQARVQREDFILLSEFSEQEGPVPVLTIRESALEEELIDFNSFVIRIMAVDHQARVGDGFSIPEDTSVFLTEPSEKFSAYVHYCTFFDSAARGFVRPVCVSYITADSNKILTHFEDIRNEFSRSFWAMKEENMNVFYNELEQRYHDLLYTKNVLNSENYSKPEFDMDDGQQTIDQDNIDSFIRETGNMMKVVYERLRHNRQKLPKSTRRITQHSPSPLFTSAIGSPRSRAVSSDTVFNGFKPKLDAVEDDDDGIRMRGPEYQPRFIRFFYKACRFDTPLRTIQRLAPDHGFRTSVEKWKRLLSYYKRPNLVLMLEKEESKMMASSPTLLTVGRTPLINFIDSRLGGGQNQQGPDMFFLSRRITVNTTIKESSKREEEISLSCSFESAKDSMISASPEYVDASDHELLEEDDIAQLKQLREAIQSTTLTGLSDKSGSETPNDFSDAMFEPSVMSRHDSFRSPVQSISSSMQDHVSLTERLAREKVPKPMAIASFVDHLWHDSSNKPGTGVLELRRRFPFLKQLLFSLLKGRPVVVLGSQESEAEVRSLISTLSLFVPGHSSKFQVHPWRTRSLTMNDLAKVKLAGLSKKTALPKNVEAYVSILDCDANTFKSPPYHGQIVETLVARQKQFVDEQAYLGHVHTILLEIAIKAFIYYHTCCVSQSDIPALRLSGGTLLMSQSEEMSFLPPSVQASVAAESKRQASAERSYTAAHSTAQSPLVPTTDESPRVETRSTTTAAEGAKPPNRRLFQKPEWVTKQRGSVLHEATISGVAYPPLFVERAKKLSNKLDWLPHDRDIIEYWVEVIKIQAIAAANLESSAITGFEVAPTIRLDLRRCQTFGNKASQQPRATPR